MFRYRSFKTIQDLRLIERSGLFDRAWYLRRYPDVAQAEVDPLRHYLKHGWREGRSPHVLIDTRYYLQNNPDVAAAGVDPLTHFCLHGWKEGRNPSPGFDTRQYLADFPELYDLEVNPLNHYLEGAYMQRVHSSKPRLIDNPHAPDIRRIAIYTSIIGNYDNLKAPLEINEDVDYFVFTDSGEDLPYPWQRVPVYAHYRNQRVTSRYYKTHPHILLRDYDLSIYFDGSIRIKQDIVKFLLETIEDHDYLACRHPKRDCIYEEGETVKRLDLDYHEVVDAQLARLRKMGYPEHYGLSESGFIVRRHHKIAEASEGWWNEILTGSHRDQMSLHFILWKYNVNYKIFDWGIRDNQFFEVIGHNFRKKYI